MSSICGQLNPNNRAVQEETIRRMCWRMVHRGPDDDGYYLKGSVGLGHRRLSIIDLSPAGHQPMSNHDGSVWIVHDGEVYNFRELGKELEAKGYRFRSNTDTEVILHLYQECGQDCLERLNGMFAFAIWDARKCKLLLARDRLGIKPLYYYFDRGKLLFASEVRALVASGCVPRKPSLQALSSYLALGAVQEPLAIVEEIYALPAGHYAIWRDGKFIIRPYWKLPEEINEDLVRTSKEEILERVKELLEDSVRLRLISDVPLGAFLSGGIDSSAIVTLMSQVSDIAPRTISVVFQEEKFSEATYSRMVVEKFKTEHEEVLVTAKDIVNELPKSIAAMDQPTFDGVNTYIVSKYTKEAGLTVALSGVGGDELFAGYESFRVIPRLERLKGGLPRPLTRSLGGLVRLLLRDSDRGRKLSRWFGGKDLVGNTYLLFRELFSPTDRQKLIPLLTNDTDVPWKELGSFSNSDPVNCISRYELSHYMRNVLLRDTDAMGMAHGLEIRAPLLDHRLVEFILGLPGALKLNRKTPKPMLIRALDRALPNELVYRRKHSFTLPFSVWMRGPLREEVKEVLLDKVTQGSMNQVFNHRAIEEIWERFLSRKGNWKRPWAIYVIRKWADGNFLR